MCFVFVLKHSLIIIIAQYCLLKLIQYLPGGAGNVSFKNVSLSFDVELFTTS